MRNQYLPTALGLYMNYFIFGTAVIIISQNLDELALKWGTDIAAVAAVVSSFGIGKMVAVYFTGRFSDRFGRKKAIKVGMLFYLIFFVGILLSPNAQVAYCFGIMAGIGNSFLDTGTYPALVEIFTKKAGPANIMVKGFIQAANILVPIFIALLVMNGRWYGWSFILAIFVLVLNLLFMSKRQFPAMAQASANDSRGIEIANDKKRRFYFTVDEICLFVFAYVAQVLLYVLPQWIAKYGSEVIQMSEMDSRMLVSYSSIGAISCVLVTFFLGNKGVRSTRILLLYTAGAAIVSFVLFAFPSPIVGLVGSIMLGYFSCGGLVQLGLTLILQKSSRPKGFITSLYTIFEGIAMFTTPIIASVISRVDISGIFLLNSIVALIGFAMIKIIVGKEKSQKLHHVLSEQEAI